MKIGSSWILRLYFAVIAAVTLFTLMFGTIDLLSLGLKTYIFKAADVHDYLENCSTVLTRYPAAPTPMTKDYIVPDETKLREECDARNQDTIQSYQRMKATSAIHDIALFLIALPLFVLHFRFVYKDWLEERKGQG